MQGMKVVKVDRDATRELVTLMPETATPKPSSPMSWLARQSDRGDVKSVAWTTSEAPANSQDVIKVQHAAINEHDLLVAQGKSISDGAEGPDRLNTKTFGLEFSGRNAKNAQVMGISTSGALRSHVVADPEYTWPVPSVWTSEEAATIPLSYAVAYATLFLKGEVKKGDKILVHDGASDVGQAIINIALEEGCIVYTTYSTEKEQKFLLARCG